MSVEALGGVWPYLLVVLVAFLPTELWRSLAVVVSRGLDDDSEILVWVRAVAATLLAGVVAKLLYDPSGALAAVPFWGRWGAMALGLAAFFAFRRSVVAGVLVGVVAVVLAASMGGA
jgi:hypothetical protein